MSSTNRGTTVRSADDAYETPAWAVRRLLDRLPLPGGTWLEPGAGNGEIINAVNRADVKWTAVESREACRPNLAALAPKPEIVIGDLLTGVLGDRRFDVAIGNPPYSMALRFVEETLRHAEVVAFLLRLNFLGSVQRWPFMSEHAPDVFVLPNRPSFTGGKTDSIEYAWFVWRQESLKRSAGTICVLDLSSSEERRGGESAA